MGLGDQLGQITDPLPFFFYPLKHSLSPVGVGIATADAADPVWSKPQPPPLAGCLMKGDRREEKENKAGALETVLGASEGPLRAEHRA